MPAHQQRHNSTMHRLRFSQPLLGGGGGGGLSVAPRLVLRAGRWRALCGAECQPGGALLGRSLCRDAGRPEIPQPRDRPRALTLR